MTSVKRRVFVVITAAYLTSIGLLVSATSAGADADLFNGKTINVIIGSSPGGGTDGTTRLVGRYLEKYLPGQPRMIYRNMPAGHGVRATNYFANVVKPDGLTWMGGSSSYVDANNLRKKVVKYNPTKFAFIGGISRGGSVVVVRKSKQADLLNPSAKPVIVGTLDGSRSWSQLITWGAEYLNWNVKYVVGYPGSAALVLAARRGEIDAFGTSTISVHRSLQKTGKFFSLAQLGETQDGKIVPRASFPDVPPMPHLMEGKTSGIAMKAFEYWIKTNQLDKWYALPPGTPEKYIRAYREAFQKAFKDPEFIKFGRYQFSADFSAQTADDVKGLMDATAYPPTEIITFLHDLKVKHGLPGTPLSNEEMAKLAKERGGILKVKATLDDVKRGGRWLHFKVDGENHKTKVSSSRTSVMIAGVKTKRNNLKPGMNCEISYLGNGGEATAVSCR